jgi:hypothetical protein
MRGYETCREVDLPLPIEGIEQGDAERLGIGRQIVQPIFGAVARDAGGRHVNITGEVERHRAMQDAAHGLEVAVLVCGLDPLEHPADGVGIAEDVMGCLPVGMLIGTAEPRHPERRRTGEGAAEIAGSGSRSDRRLERGHDRARIVAEEQIGERHMV